MIFGTQFHETNLTRILTSHSELQEPRSVIFLLPVLLPVPLVLLLAGLVLLGAPLVLCCLVWCSWVLLWGFCWLFLCSWVLLWCFCWFV